jgi:hypothetical protein
MMNRREWGDKMRKKAATLAATVAWAFSSEAQAEERIPPRSWRSVLSEWIFPGGVTSLGPSASIRPEQIVFLHMPPSSRHVPEDER